jgi:hypothetical protein
LPDFYIRSITFSRFDPNRIYVAMTGINEDDLHHHLFVSEDLGVHWISITDGLPDETVNCMAEDPLNEDFLYAGLHRGVFISTDRGRSWNLLGGNMAPTVISDLVIQERELDLVAGTHGRGIYKMNLQPIHEAFENGYPEKSVLFPVPVLVSPWINDTHRDVNETTVTKTEITWWQQDPGPVQIVVLKGDKSIWQKDFNGKKGFNQFRWDGVVKTDNVQEAYFFRYKTYIDPGIYLVRIKAANWTGEQQLTVIEPERYE